MFSDRQRIRDLQVERLRWPSQTPPGEVTVIETIIPSFHFKEEEKEELGDLVAERQEQRAIEFTGEQTSKFLESIQEDIAAFLLEEIIREDELDALRPRKKAPAKGELALTRTHFERLRRKIEQLRHGLSVETVHTLDPEKKDDPELGNYGWTYLYHELSKRGLTPPKDALREEFSKWIKYLETVNEAIDAAHDRLPDQPEDMTAPWRVARVLLVARISEKYKARFGEFPPSTLEAEDDDEADGEYDPDILPEAIIRGRRARAPMTTLIRRIFKICFIEVRRASVDYIREAKRDWLPASESGVSSHSEA